MNKLNFLTKSIKQDDHGFILSSFYLDRVFIKMFFKKFYLAFIIIYSLLAVNKSFSQNIPNSSQEVKLIEEVISSKNKACMEFFDTPPLNEEKYSSKFLKRYINSSNYYLVMNLYPVLSEDLLEILFKRWDDYEDKRAYNILFLSSLKTVEKAVRKHNLNNNNYEDAFQTGLITLIKALNSYKLKEERDRFSAYLYMAVKNTIIIHENITTKAVPVKIRRWTLLKELKDERDKHPDTFNTDEWLEDFSIRRPHLSLNHIRTARDAILSRNPISLNMPIRSANGDENSMTLIDMLPERENFDRRIHNIIYLEQVREHIKNRLKKEGKGKIYEIILDNYLLSPDPPLLTEIARDIGVSPQRVHHVRNILLEKIRQLAKNVVFKEDID